MDNALVRIIELSRMLAHLASYLLFIMTNNLLVQSI